MKKIAFAIAIWVVLIAGGVSASLFHGGGAITPSVQTYLADDSGTTLTDDSGNRLLPQ